MFDQTLNIPLVIQLMGKRVLVPIDGSEQARKALETALDVFGDEEIVVIHVIDTKAFNYADSMLPSAYDRSVEGDIQRSVEEQARGLIESSLEVAREYDVEIDTEIETGKPAPQIIQYAEENDIDHIVIGSHGHTEITRRWFGSVADRVVKDAPVTVTVVR